MRIAISATLIALALTACGSGDDSAEGPAETVTVTVTAEADDVGAVEPSEAPSSQEGVSVLVVDEPMTLGPNDDGDTASVTLHSVSYPEPKPDDAGAVEEGNVLVQVEWTIENVGDTDVYGVPVYPGFQTADGQVREAEWEYGLYGDYGSKGFEDEMPDSLRPGQFASGWSIYEIPRENGVLIFAFGPGEAQVVVEPPA